MADGVPRLRQDRADTGRRWLTWALIGALCLAALTAAGAVLVGEFGDVEERTLLTMLALGGAALTAMAASTQAERRPPLAAIGIGASAVSLVSAAVATWAPVVGVPLRSWSGDAFVLAIAVAAVVAVAVAHAALLLPRRGEDRPGVAAVLRPTLILSGLLSMLLIGLILADYLILILPVNVGGEATFRLVGASAVLVALGTLLVPLLRRMDGGRAPGIVGRDDGSAGGDADGGAA